MRPIRRVAILGTGTMGAKIAAHFANAGIPALALDIDSATAQRGVQAAAKARPAAFFVPGAASLIRTGGFDTDLPQIRDCDWILEAVSENLEIKRSLWMRVAELRAAGSVVSTNTSGIPLASISEGFPEEFRQHFLGTHFFNPPRYLHLLELIRGADTLPEIAQTVSEFAEKRLGKGVVPCKDTPNFIANRIGSLFGATVQMLTVEGDYTIEEVDLLTGPLIGLPKSASYRLLDIVGIDVWAHVTRNLAEAVTNDPYQERFIMQPFLVEMIRRGWLGDKSGQGCYRKAGAGAEKVFEAINWKTLEYRPPAKPRFPSVDAARNIDSLPERLRMLVASDDRAGRFLRTLFTDLVTYSALMVPEIADRIVEIDRAMRWGYGNALGPFELWDALGVAEIARSMERVPPNVERMLATGAQSFYRDGQYFDFQDNAYRDLEPRPGVTVLSRNPVIQQNAGASLKDLGDGVLCVEFHSKMNAMGDDALRIIQTGIAETEKNFAAMVVANQGEHFSAGANLMLVLLAAQDEEWDELDAAIRRFQNTNMAMKYAPRPVVAAPFSMTLGGGCEVVLHAARAQASAELYMGLVEAGVGLIPAGGGCKEMLMRFGNAKPAFELIGYAKMSGSAAEARSLGLLRDGDGITMNPERLVGDAKALALTLARDYAPGAPREDIPVEGDSAYALMKLGVYLAREGEFISDYDAVIGEKLAHILSGGRGTQRNVSEQHLLDLEREAFLSLCGRRETQQRIQHMLKTGKPLRN